MLKHTFKNLFQETYISLKLQEKIKFAKIAENDKGNILKKSRKKRTYQKVILFI